MCANFPCLLCPVSKARDPLNRFTRRKDEEKRGRQKEKRHSCISWLQGCVQETHTFSNLLDDKSEAIDSESSRMHACAHEH